jgi:hypothetical protein
LPASAQRGSLFSIAIRGLNVNRKFIGFSKITVIFFSRFAAHFSVLDYSTSKARERQVFFKNSFRLFYIFYSLLHRAFQVVGFLPKSTCRDGRPPLARVDKEVFFAVFLIRNF